MPSKLFVILYIQSSDWSEARLSSGTLPGADNHILVSDHGGTRAIVIGRQQYAAEHTELAASSIGRAGKSLTL